MNVQGSIFKVKANSWTNNQGEVIEFLQANLDSGDDLVKVTLDKSTTQKDWMSLEGQDVLFTAAVSVGNNGSLKIRLSDPTPLSSQARLSRSSGRTSEHSS